MVLNERILCSLLSENTCDFTCPVFLHWLDAFERIRLKKCGGDGCNRKISLLCDSLKMFYIQMGKTEKELITAEKGVI